MRRSWRDDGRGLWSRLSKDEGIQQKSEMINAETQLYGIIGNPVRKSLSPVIHNGAFRRMGMNAAYLAFEVDDIEDVLYGIKGLGIQGVSVTLPFKTRVIPFLDELDALAEKIGAVNTIVNKRGQLIGHNTDHLGALKALEEKVDMRGRKVILLGAGGAARAIAYGLKDRECQVTIFNRSPQRAATLAQELGYLHHPLSVLFDIKGDRLDADVLINATSVGMIPHEAKSPFPKRLLRKGMIVMDIVYRPLRTQLLQAAESQGCETIDGLQMLAYQGAAQLEIWTGQSPDGEEIKTDLRKTLQIEHRFKETP
jgi:shikimate dehydrogenase